MSPETLIDRLSAEAVPVRRRSVARETGWLVGLGALELGLVLAAGVMRPDMAQAVGHPFMWWKLGSLAVLVALSVATAVSSFSPVISPRRGLGAITGFTAVVLIAATLIDPGHAAAPTLAGRLSPLHGLGCATAIVVLALPMLALLAVFMRRGASTHPEGSALAVGLAGASWGAFVFAFCCPSDDPLYIVVWYAAGCAIVALLARATLPRHAAL